MKKFFKKCLFTLTIVAGMAFAAPQNTNAENPGIKVLSKYFHTEITVVEGGYWWWLKDKDGKTIMYGYTDTSGRTQSAVWGA